MLNVQTVNALINLRGLREQSFVFAFKKLGKRQKGCFTKGCEIFAPISHALKGVDLSSAIEYEKYKNRELAQLTPQNRKDILVTA